LIHLVNNKINVLYIYEFEVGGDGDEEEETSALLDRVLEIQVRKIKLFHV
jgi:hypothetical protein